MHDAGAAFIRWQERLGLTNDQLARALKAVDLEGKGATPRTISNLRAGLRPGVRIERLLERLAKERGRRIAPVLREMRPHG